MLNNISQRDESMGEAYLKKKSYFALPSGKSV
jgi:hypothetical protein